MTKKKYLEELRDELSFLDKKDVEEIISDIENFIIEEKNNKKKIKDILESLGTPQEVAGNYKMETPEKESIKDITKKLFKELNSTVNKGVSTFIHNVNSNYKNWSEPRVNKMNEKLKKADGSKVTNTIKYKIPKVIMEIIGKFLFIALKIIFIIILFNLIGLSIALTLLLCTQIVLFITYIIYVTNTTAIQPLFIIFNIAFFTFISTLIITIYKLSKVLVRNIKK